MRHAILFDFDGVILDDEPIHFFLFNEGLAPLGYRIAEAEYYEMYVGFDDVDGFTAVVVDQGGRLAPARVATLVWDKTSRYQSLMDDDPPLFAGAAAVIRRLAAHHPLAIASGALRVEIEGVPNDAPGRLIPGGDGGGGRETRQARPGGVGDAGRDQRLVRALLAPVDGEA